MSSRLACSPTAAAGSAPTGLASRRVTSWWPCGTRAGPWPAWSWARSSGRVVPARSAPSADALARPDAHTVGLVGTGRQAWAQLWALAAVRGMRQVRVYSPSVQHREGFVARARAELGLAASASSDAASAVCDADIVVLATRSTEPVIEAADVAIGAHVTTVGPKFRNSHEAPLQLATAAAVLTCDSPEQAAAYPEPFFTGSTPLTSLADVLLGVAPGRRNRDDITMHCSVGLAGSEVLLAQRLLASE